MSTVDIPMFLLVAKLSTAWDKGCQLAWLLLYDLPPPSQYFNRLSKRWIMWPHWPLILRILQMWGGCWSVESFHTWHRDSRDPKSSASSPFFLSCISSIWRQFPAEILQPWLTTQNLWNVPLLSRHCWLLPVSNVSTPRWFPATNSSELSVRAGLYRHSTLKQVGDNIKRAIFYLFFYLFIYLKQSSWLNCGIVGLKSHCVCDLWRMEELLVFRFKFRPGQAGPV